MRDSAGKEIDQLIGLMAKLPGLGPRSARRGCGCTARSDRRCDRRPGVPAQHVAGGVSDTDDTRPEGAGGVVGELLRHS